MPHDTRGWAAGGASARAVNRRLALHRSVRLELDLVRRDRYGRLLAYVWVRRRTGLVMVNAEMIRRGYAQVMTIPPNVRHSERFLKLQREARDARRGLWRQP